MKQKKKQQAFTIQLLSRRLSKNRLSFCFSISKTSLKLVFFSFALISLLCFLVKFYLFFFLYFIFGLRKRSSSALGFWNSNHKMARIQFMQPIASLSIYTNIFVSYWTHFYVKFYADNWYTKICWFVCLFASESLLLLLLDVAVVTWDFRAFACRALWATRDNWKRQRNEGEKWPTSQSLPRLASLAQSTSTPWAKLLQFASSNNTSAAEEYTKQNKEPKRAVGLKIRKRGI